MPLTQWMQELLDILCKIYRCWFGKSCSDFDGDPSLAISLVVGTFNREGPPIFPEPRDKEEFKGYLDVLEGLLAEPGNTLTPAQNATLQEFLVEIRKAIG